MACFLALAAALPAAAQKNIALGKPYSFSRRPTYPYCTDPDDKTQLTDGVFTEGKFWTQPGAVGWGAGHGTSLDITIDLGETHPISGVSYSTVAGYAGVRWPAALLLFTSDDGKSWFEAGDLVRLSNLEKKPTPYGKYSRHKFVTNALRTRGRFLRVAVAPTPIWIFVDEIEVFRGPDALLQESLPGRPVDDVAARVSGLRFHSRVQAQLRRDLEAAVADVEALPRGAGALTTRAQALAREIEAMPDVWSENFRAALPMSDLERKLFRFQAEVWRAAGKPPLRVWKTHRWDLLAPSQEPAVDAPPPALSVTMMSNEHRADVVNLTNAAERDASVRLQVRGLPGGLNPPYVSVHQVLHVGTKDAVEFDAVPTALPEAARQGDAFLVTVPSGMTRQVWLSFHPRDVPAGVHAGEVLLEPEGGEPTRVPLRLRVHPLRFPDVATLHFGGWAYSDRNDIYGLKPGNRDPLVAHLREHLVNAPWGTSSALPNGKFDADGNLVAPPSTEHLDAWIEQWPDAKLYLVFKNLAGGQFDGAEAGTELCERKIASWARFWADHMREIGRTPRQLGLLLVDEPHGKRQFELSAIFAKAVKKAEPEIVLWTDPTPDDSEPCREMMELMDVLCAPWVYWVKGDEQYRERFRRHLREDKQLWFYNSPPQSDPDCLLDPYVNYALRGWWCFLDGAAGSAIWAFADTGTVSNWNPYDGRATRCYAPVYLDDTSVTPAKYMEAMREGVQDYECLIMLRRRVQELERRGVNTEALSRAGTLLAQACDRVLQNDKRIPEMQIMTRLDWRTPRDRSLADQVRGEILDALSALRGF